MTVLLAAVADDVSELFFENSTLFNPAAEVRTKGDWTNAVKSLS
jgi:hypothetical protein